MAKMPRTSDFDSTLAVMKDPYRFILKTSERLSSAVFETRLGLQRTVCMVGPEAAELFYNPLYFQRTGAAPEPLKKTLLGEGTVQGLDGDAHAYRKAMFMSLMSRSRIDDMTAILSNTWRLYAKGWAQRDRIDLYSETQGIFAEAACEWSGIPLPADEPTKKARITEIVELFDSAGRMFTPHLKSRLARKRLDRWAAAHIEDFRRGRLTSSPESAVAIIASYRLKDGTNLDPKIAGAELLNVIRPITAIAVYVVQSALALHRYAGNTKGDWDDSLLQSFVQEVRRFFPFFPQAVAKVKTDFVGLGYEFPKGGRALLDLHGTNHSRTTYKNPEVFQADRFLNVSPSAFNLIPQGGGDHFTGHRCAGEWMTIALMKASVRFLREEITYKVPPQNLDIDYRRLPALPFSRFQMDTVVLSR